MKVTGFTLIRNAIAFDYPVVEAINSILPLCDEVVVAVGESEDNTLELIRDVHPTKIRIVETVWDKNLRQGGTVLARETEKALRAINDTTDWAIYVQADEVVHENSYEKIYESMKKWKDDKQVEGMLFDYLHFYGSYNYIADAYSWCRREVRIVRPGPQIFSYRDALGFRKFPNEKLKVKHAGGLIYHYGYVKQPEQMMAKTKEFSKLWHDDEWVEEQLGDAKEFDYSKVDSLQKFEGIHPAVMKERVSKQSWNFEFDTSKSRMKLRYRIRKWLKDKLGISIGEYKNYKLI